MKKEFGEHNEACCESLYNSGNYYDWVITTAFYSSIHFIDYKLFPITDSDGDVYNNITEARKKIKKIFGPAAASPHSTREYLVTNYLSSQKSNYAYLEKNSRNARYKNYQVKINKAKIAKQRLAQIKAKCL